eukprot:TRINITY_DN10002_c0_g1_i1.p1 TRINITY_DN10002_c0_g1~~TRINITY_DN10002_c0_g1_i1.p1  ORF type:complete len:373 (-),score=46.81 TRINITY_DN10002_c0_g1_i1:11-994(-)
MDAVLRELQAFAQRPPSSPASVDQLRLEDRLLHLHSLDRTRSLLQLERDAALEAQAKATARRAAQLQALRYESAHCQEQIAGRQHLPRDFPPLLPLADYATLLQLPVPVVDAPTEHQQTLQQLDLELRLRIHQATELEELEERVNKLSSAAAQHQAKSDTLTTHCRLLATHAAALTKLVGPAHTHPAAPAQALSLPQPLYHLYERVRIEVASPTLTVELVEVDEPLTEALGMAIISERGRVQLSFRTDLQKVVLSTSDPSLTNDLIALGTDGEDTESAGAGIPVFAWLQRLCGIALPAMSADPYRPPVGTGKGFFASFISLLVGPQT